MPPRKPPKADAAADPDRLVRQPDGGYRTGDERFGVGQANGSWFLTDQHTADEFGQPRATGPFATLNAVREAIPDARSAPTSIRRPIKQAPAGAKPKRAALPPKPETWLDKLPTADRRRAGRMIAALEAAGLADAEDVARARIEGRPDRKLATRLLKARLDRVLDQAGADDDARRLVAEAVRVLAADGGRIGPDLPGWALMEIDADGSVTGRRIDPD